MAKRRSPPLFEVMRETGKRIGMGPPGAPGSSRPPPPTWAGGVPGLGRASTAAPPPLPRSQIEARRPLPDVLDAPPASGEAESAGPRRVSLSSSVLWAAGGALVLVLVLTWVMAYQLGARNERNRLLGRADQPPPPISPETPGVGRRSESRPAAARPTAATQSPSTAGSVTRPPAPPVGIDDDPRVAGVNYLIIASLRREDAERAAAFLTDSGVPSAVVVPEGKSEARLRQDPRATWQVIAREGVPSGEFRASAQRRADLESKVKQLGARWKADHKGVANFADCGWDRFDGK